MFDRNSPGVGMLRSHEHPRALGAKSDMPVISVRIAAAALIASLGLPAAAAGDAERGRALLLQRHETGCILCHVVPGLPLGGAIGPPLLDIAKRLEADNLRARIADARRFNPDTVMPPTRSTVGLQKVAAPYVGRSLLTEQALDDIVAYLLRPVPAPDAAR